MGNLSETQDPSFPIHPIPFIFPLQCFIHLKIHNLSDGVEEGALLTMFEAIQTRFESRRAVALAEVRVADT